MASGGSLVFSGSVFRVSETPLSELTVDLGTSTQRTASLSLRPLFHGHTDPRRSPEPQEEAPQEVGAAPPRPPGGAHGLRSITPGAPATSVSLGFLRPWK